MKEVIINKMYSGEYLKQGDNIGHEIINLYKADNGNNYIYLNPSGAIEMSHKKYDITILLVRYFTNSIYKILAKAEGVEIHEFADSKIKPSDRFIGQNALNLSYGGVKLIDIFKDNVYQQNPEIEQYSFTTFKVDKIIRPKEQIFYTDKVDKSNPKENIFFIETKKGLGRQNLREFHAEDEKPNSFKDFNRIIDNPELWESKDLTEKVIFTKENIKDAKVSILEIIKQDKNELVYSNLLNYFFNYDRELFIKFCKEVLKVRIGIEYEIFREKFNIDLLIVEASNVIIIENKIKSSINGIVEKHDIKSAFVQSQLKKYYEKIKNEEEYKDKKIHCFIFAPNYNPIDLNCYDCGEFYSLVYYRDILNFFNKYRDEFADLDYFDILIDSLEKQTKDYEDDLEEEMQRRFFRKLYSLKQEIKEKYNTSKMK